MLATGGTGTGGGLGNQGALSLDGRRLFVVNPGSDSISSFRVKDAELSRHRSLRGRPADQPHGRGRLLYVLNAGGAGNITGHTVSRHGALSPLAGSSRPLSGAGAGPAQVSFDPRGETLVVTEKATNLIDTYEVDDDTGSPAGRTRSRRRARRRSASPSTHAGT